MPPAPALVAPLPDAVDERLVATATAFAGQLDLEHLQQEICRQVLAVNGVVGCGLFADDARQLGQPPVAQISCGVCNPLTAVEHGLLAQAMRAQSPRVGREGADEFQAALPLIADDTNEGALMVWLSQPAEGRDDTIRTLGWIAELAGPALRSARIHSEVARLARVDYLTGCLNRSALAEAIRAEVECARHDRQPLSLLMLDLNDFKAINEQLGHSGGDRLLHAVGVALQLAVRPGDPVGRYGGDEFCVVLRRSDERQATEVAMRVVGAVTDAVMSVASDRASQATVAGVAQWCGEPAGHLLARADRALMYAKADKHGVPFVCASEVPTDFMVEAGVPVPPSAIQAGSSDIAVDRLRRRSQQLLVVAGLASRLIGLREQDAILRVVASEIYNGLGYYHCCIDTACSDGSWERLQGEGASYDNMDSEMHWRSSGGIVGRAIAQGRTQLVHDIEHDPDYQPSSDQKIATRSELCVPVFVGGHVWGVINVEEQGRHAFDQHDQFVLEILAAHLGAALGLASSSADLQSGPR